MSISVLVGNGEGDVGRTRTGQRLQHHYRVLLIGEDVYRGHDNIRDRSRPANCCLTDSFAYVIPFDQLAEDTVIKIKVPSRRLGDEELRVVRVVSALGERQNARPVVLQIGMELIIEVSQI